MGNKTSILHILYALFPLNYERYIEPFGGSGAVLLGKKKPDKFEVYNDFNHNLVNLFRCMRDRPMAFIKELGFYPLNSRDDFNAIRDFFRQEKFDDKYLDEELELTKIILPDLKAEEVIELYVRMKQDYDLRRAVMFLKLLRYSYSSGGKSFACQPFSVVSLFQLIEQVGKRLENTVIENQDFEVLIKHYDRENAFFYCDPPYYSSEYVYQCGFTWDDHLRLKNTLANSKGKWLVSYNDCKEIRELYGGYSFFDFTRLHNMKQRINAGEQFPELLISNYDMYERQRNSHRLVESVEQRKIIQNATRKNKLKSSGNDVNETIEAQGNLQDVVTLMANLRKNKEPLLHCSVFIEIKAKNKQKLKELQTDIAMELTRSKIEVDRLTLRQKEGFLSVNPIGSNQFGSLYERVLPASSVANLFPFNFSGKTDPNGLYIGRDKYGTNILVDFDRRTEDKTTSNILILGNSGQGKSYLLKLILTNIRESGKKIVCLDPEAEYEDLTNALGGCYIDFMSGKYKINPLEPKAWNDGQDEIDKDAPPAFNKVTRLSQHIAFLKDFFRTYKDFTDAQLDTIEILLMKLYARFGITDTTDYSTKKPSDFPVMSDFYDLCEEEYMTYDHKRKYLYTEEILHEVCLGIHSMCVGSESKYFNGHTNITDDKFLCFGVKGLLDTNKRLKDAMLFNILSYMSNKLLGEGNTVASIDELYLFLSNLTAIEYIRNAMKRVRKKDSAVILASQNIEDFLIQNVKEYTKPLFSIPTHHFLFYPGNINPKDFEDALMVEPNEYALIKFGERGTCLYRCGNERYLLLVQAPEYKAEIFGSAGGR